MYYVYIIRSLPKPDELYTGFTEDLKARIAEHNTGRSPHTSKFYPWQLLYYSAFEDKKSALDFEKYLKSSSGKAFRDKRLTPFIDKNI